MLPLRTLIHGVRLGIDPIGLTDLVWALRADDLTLADGAAVVTWTDAKSGLAFTNTDVTRRPTLIHNARNGHKIVRFTGASFHSLAASSSAMVGTNRTILAVMKHTVNAATNTIFGVGASNWRVVANASGRLQSVYVDSAAATQTHTVGAGTQFDGNYVIASWRVETVGANVRITMRINGVLRYDITVATGHAAAGSTPRIGGGGATSTNLTGDIGDLYVFSTAVPFSNVIDMTRFLARKYLIAVP